MVLGLLAALAACGLPAPRAAPPSPIGRLHRYRVDGKPLTLYRKSPEILESLGQDAQGRAIHGIAALDPRTGQIIRLSLATVPPCGPRRPFLSLTRLLDDHIIDIARVGDDGRLERFTLPLPSVPWGVADLALYGVPPPAAQAPTLRLSPSPTFLSGSEPLRIEPLSETPVSAERWQTLLASAAPPCPDRRPVPALK